jgi:hypothetical protein
LPGGHGGIEELILRTPLFVYKKNSSCGAITVENDPITCLDVGTTVSGLLGVPVSRQSEGKFINSLVPMMSQQYLLTYYRDLYLQKQIYIKNFYTALGATPPSITTPQNGN